MHLRAADFRTITDIHSEMLKSYLNEARRAKRIPVARTAWIAYAADTPSLSCSVANVSEQGALIVLPEDAPEIPDQFLLLLTPTGEVHRSCRVVWRAGQSLGLFFDPAVKYPKPLFQQLELEI